ncbi:MAG: hypothetical protein ACOYWZ_01365 [Bacillota bacterium]
MKNDFYKHYMVRTLFLELFPGYITLMQLNRALKLDLRFLKPDSLSLLLELLFFSYAAGCVLFLFFVSVMEVFSLQFGNKSEKRSDLYQRYPVESYIISVVLLLMFILLFGNPNSKILSLINALVVILVL